jgi:hypothetical protein
MSASCRFELLLPLRFNDGTTVPKALLAGAVMEIERHFGAASWESQIIEGIWHQGGVKFRDQLNRIFVETEDTLENRRFFTDLKQRLKSQFQQLDIRLTAHPIEVL